MSAEKIIPVDQDFAARAHIDGAAYEKLYRASLEDPDRFWLEQAKQLDWIKPPSQAGEWVYSSKKVEIRWFADGVLNAAANCIDRHAEARPDDIAIIWEADEPGESRHISWREMLAEVSRLANLLKSEGVGRGDRVTIYLPMIPLAAYAMLACARIGAVHSVVFGGFSPAALAGRIDDCRSDFVITADGGRRGGKPIPLKDNVDAALKISSGVRRVLVARHSGEKVAMTEGRDIWLDEKLPSMAETCPPEAMGAEDPLFILYTSGSTGKPKGVLHTTGGYLTYAALTFRSVFDYRAGDIFWCTADVGWVTGHSYIVYGPLASGASVVMFEGVPNYPAADRFWQVCDKHKVTIFYTAPTALRALMREGDALLASSKRTSLRLLGTVGEPINPEAWRWYYEAVGQSRSPIVDTWWQTETGGILITPLAGAHALKPGAASLPFFGIRPVLLDDDGKEVRGAGRGNLCLAGSWPGQMRTVFGDHQRFIETYFTRFDGYYFTGDGARRDEDGYYWITGRVDDVINVSGHRLGTAEVESALVAHGKVAEAAVVGFPHPVKGQGIYAYVTLTAGSEESESLRQDLLQQVRREIGAIARPDYIQFAPSLPKTRSGKIMRRILRAAAAGESENLGDLSTLADPASVDDILARAAALKKG